MVRVKNKIVASTFVEVLVALVLVMLAFGLGIGVYMSVVDSNKSVATHKARSKVVDILHEMNQNKAFIDHAIEEDECSIKITFATVSGAADNLQEMTIEAKNNKQQLLFIEQHYILTH